jgi:hypothetical protein
LHLEPVQIDKFMNELLSGGSKKQNFIMTLHNLTFIQFVARNECYFYCVYFIFKPFVFSQNTTHTICSIVDVILMSCAKKSVISTSFCCAAVWCLRPPNGLWRFYFH